jgi:hypothetical protein
MDGSGDEHMLPHDESSAASQDEDARRQQQQLHDKVSHPKERSPLKGLSDDLQPSSLVLHGLSSSKHTNSPSTAVHKGESRIPAPSKVAGRRRISGGAGEAVTVAGNLKDISQVSAVTAPFAEEQHEHVAVAVVAAVPVVEKRRRRPSLSNRPPPAVIEISAHDDGPPPLWSPALDNR